MRAKHTEYSLYIVQFVVALLIFLHISALCSVFLQNHSFLDDTWKLPVRYFLYHFCQLLLFTVVFRKLPIFVVAPCTYDWSYQIKVNQILKFILLRPQWSVEKYYEQNRSKIIRKSYLLTICWNSSIINRQ